MDSIQWGTIWGRLTGNVDRKTPTNNLPLEFVKLKYDVISFVDTLRLVTADSNPERQYREAGNDGKIGRFDDPILHGTFDNECEGVFSKKNDTFGRRYISFVGTRGKIIKIVMFQTNEPIFVKIVFEYEKWYIIIQWTGMNQVEIALLPGDKRVVYVNEKEVSNTGLDCRVLIDDAGSIFNFPQRIMESVRVPVEPILVELQP